MVKGACTADACEGNALAVAADAAAGAVAAIGVVAVKAGAAAESATAEAGRLGIWRQTMSVPLQRGCLPCRCSCTNYGCLARLTAA